MFERRLGGGEGVGQVTQGATETALHGPQVESRPGVQRAQVLEQPHEWRTAKGADIKK